MRNENVNEPQNQQSCQNAVMRGTFSYTNGRNEKFLEEKSIIKGYSLKSKSKKPRIIYISMTKPERNKCDTLDCFYKIPFGIQSYKIDNWDELPQEIEFDAEHFKTYYYENVKEIRFV